MRDEGWGEGPALGHKGVWALPPRVARPLAEWAGPLPYSMSRATLGISLMGLVPLGSVLAAVEAVLGAARPLHHPGDRSEDRGEVGAGGIWAVSLVNLGLRPSHLLGGGGGPVGYY
jgi:hypothetical protein